VTAVIIGAYEDAATAIAALAPAGGKRRAAVLPRAAVDDEARVRLRQAYSMYAQFRGPKFDATPAIDAREQLLLRNR